MWPDHLNSYDQGHFDGISAGERFTAMLGESSPTELDSSLEFTTWVVPLELPRPSSSANIPGGKTESSASMLLLSLVLPPKMLRSPKARWLLLGSSLASEPACQLLQSPSYNPRPYHHTLESPHHLGSAGATLFTHGFLQWRFSIACQVLLSGLVLLCCPFI